MPLKMPFFNFPGSQQQQQPTFLPNIQLQLSQQQQQGVKRQLQVEQPLHQQQQQALEDKVGEEWDFNFSF
jgi:hypothetical protein